MKKKRKLCILFFMLLMTAMVTGIVSADEMKVIRVNTSVSGKAAERASNLYQFSVGQNGKLNIQLKHENLFDTKTYWTVELLADDMETVLQTYDSTGTDTKKIGGSYGVTAGTYYVKVYAKKECSHEYADKPYQLYVKFKPSSSWEIEYNAVKKQGNNNQATAMSLKAGKYAYGTISSSSDVDFFKIKIRKSGTLSLDFRHPNIYEKDTYWNVQLVNAKTNKIYELNSAGTKTKNTTAAIGVSAGTYYVRIAGGGSSRFSDRDYKIRVIYKPTSSWEKEYTNKTNKFNNSMQTANTLTRGKWMNGIISSEDDVDYMKVTIPYRKTVQIKFKHTYQPRRAKWWKVSVYNSRTTEIYSFYSRGVDESLTKRLLLNRGTYFIKVSKGTSWTKRAYQLYVK